MRCERTIAGLCWLAIFSIASLALGQAVDAPAGVPDPESIARATRLVKTTFREEYGTLTTPARRASLAQRLCREADQTRDDPVARYVLLCEARDLAAGAGDASTAARAIGELSRLYGVAPGEMIIAALAISARNAALPAAHETVARCAMIASDEAIIRDEYEIAGRLAAIAQSEAARAKRPSLLAEAQDKVKDAAWAATEHEKVRPALEALSGASADADARAAAGRFKCLVKGDFARGLALVIEGSDETWRKLAEADRIAGEGADPSARASAGNSWWDLGQTLGPHAREHCRQRAGYWYRQALPGLLGITRTTTQKRLEEIEQALLRRLRLEPGLLGEYFAGEQFEKLVQRRIDAQLDHEWPAAPIDGVPRDHFSVRWTGKLRVPASGNYTLLLHANEGARVYIGQRLIIDLPDGSHKRNGKKETIALTEGLHDLRVEAWDAGGIARLRLLWVTPLSPQEEPIPAKAFVHEADGQTGEGPGK